jgi:hypothetical protein
MPLMTRLTAAALVAACALMGPAQADPQSCMPNAPYGRAPQWAVDVVKHRGGDIPTSATDPVWQHAMCDKSRRTVEWRLPGEDMK